MNKLTKEDGDEFAVPKEEKIVTINLDETPTALKKNSSPANFENNFLSEGNKKSST